MHYDCIALGEVMLRFDPGDTRIATASSFRVWEGGGEYNVVRGLSHCFKRPTAVVTALVDNEIGRLIAGRIAAGRVATDFISWHQDDGIGESCRNSVYFLEKGFGLRPALGVMDRGHSAISQLQPGDIDWQQLFASHQVRWFHTGGIMAGLSRTSAEVVIEAMQAARACGVTVSYDLNYRPSLWRRFGGKEGAMAVNRRIMPHVDVLFGVEELERAPEGLETELFRRALERTASAFPHLTAIATTMRHVRSAGINDFSGLLCHQGQIVAGPRFEQLEIYDRVGAGDAFAAGIIHGLLAGLEPERIVAYGVVHGALTMTTPGDNSMASQAEIERIIAGGSAAVQR